MAYYFKHKDIPGLSTSMEYKGALKVFNYIRPTIDSAVSVASWSTDRETRLPRYSGPSFNSLIGAGVLAMLQALTESKTLPKVEIITTGAITTSASGLVKESTLSTDIYQNIIVKSMVIYFDEDELPLDSSGHSTQHVTFIECTFDVVKNVQHSFTTSHKKKKSSATVLSPTGSAAKS